MTSRKKILTAAAVIFLTASRILAAPETSAGGTTAIFTAGFIFPAGFAVYPGLEHTFTTFSLRNGSTVGLGVSARGQIAYVERKDLYSMTAVGGGMFASAALYWKNLHFFLYPGAGISLYAFSGDPAYYSTRENS